MQANPLLWALLIEESDLHMVLQANPLQWGLLIDERDLDMVFQVFWVAALKWLGGGEEREEMREA